MQCVQSTDDIYAEIFTRRCVHSSPGTGDVTIVCASCKPLFSEVNKYLSSLFRRGLFDFFVRAGKWGQVKSKRAQPWDSLPTPPIFIFRVFFFRLLRGRESKKHFQCVHGDLNFSFLQIFVRSNKPYFISHTFMFLISEHQETPIFRIASEPAKKAINLISHK